MKISILLPYKENFSPEYPGAVSLFVYETSKTSKFKKDIVVFGNTNFKNKFKIKYENVDLFKNPLSSQTKTYVSKFINLQKKYNFSIIEFPIPPVAPVTIILFFFKSFIYLNFLYLIDYLLKKFLHLC